MSRSVPQPSIRLSASIRKHCEHEVSRPEICREIAVLEPDIQSCVASARALRHGYPMTRLLWLWVSLVACSNVAVPSSRRPDGSWQLKCGATMDACVRRASELCKERGYVVLGGMSKRQLYGAELGVSQVEERESELQIACADRRGDLPTVLHPFGGSEAASANPVSSASAQPPLPLPSSAPSNAHVASCTPGSTQRCVGPGACSGGQACLPDGSGYAACDCSAPTTKTQ